MNYNVAYNRRIRAQRRAAAQCIDCGILSPRLRCAECRGKQADARSARNVERIKEGLCTRCANRREPGRTMCCVCLGYLRGRKSKQYTAIDLMIAVAAIAS